MSLWAHALDGISLRLVARIGEGGSGTLFEAVAPHSGHKFTVKVGNTSVPAGDDTDPLAREARLGRQLRHPAWVRVHGLASLKRWGRVHTALVRDFAEGAPLSDILVLAAKRDEPLPIAAIARLGSDIAAGLCVLHELEDDTGQVGYAHADLSPHNVMIGAHGAHQLIDLGHAAPLNPQDAIPITGKAAYLAPERHAGAPPSVAADLYALGVTLWECVSLCKFAALPPAKAPGLEGLRPDTPPELAALIAACLAHDPSHRPESAAAVWEQLRPLITLERQPSLEALAGELAGTLRRGRISVTGRAGGQLVAGARVEVVGDPTALRDRRVPPRPALAAAVGVTSVAVAVAGVYATRPRQAPPVEVTTPAALSVKKTPVERTEDSTEAASVSHARPDAAAPQPAALPSTQAVQGPAPLDPAPLDPAPPTPKTPPPKTTTPKTTNLAEKAPTRVSRGSEAQATIRISVLPWGNVWLDGKALGRSPQEVRVAPGRHRVAIGAEDPGPERTVSVKPGQSRELVLRR